MTNKSMATLDMFFDADVTDAFQFTPDHITYLTKMWKKYGRDNKLANFNHDFHLSLLRGMNNADVLYRATIGIPVYSDIAKIVAVERGLIK